MPNIKKLKKYCGVEICGQVVFMQDTVELYSNQDVIKKYIQNQGKDMEYTKLYQGKLNLDG